MTMEQLSGVFLLIVAVVFARVCIVPPSHSGTGQNPPPKGRRPPPTPLPPRSRQ